MGKPISKIEQEWTDKARKLLVGKTIAEVRYLTDEEQKALDWYSKGITIFFEDGSYIFPSKDGEGNNAGALFTSDNDLEVIPAI